MSFAIPTPSTDDACPGRNSMVITDTVCFNPETIKGISTHEELCVVAPSLAEDGTDQFVDFDTICSGESIFKTFTFETYERSPDIEKCMEFWKSVLAKNLHPIKCTPIMKNDKKVDKALSVIEIPYTQSPTLNKDGDLWSEVYHEIQAKKLNEVKLTRTRKCSEVFDYSEYKTREKSDKKEQKLLIKQLNDWTPTKKFHTGNSVPHIKVEPSLSTTVLVIPEKSEEYQSKDPSIVNVVEEKQISFVTNKKSMSDASVEASFASFNRHSSLIDPEFPNRQVSTDTKVLLAGVQYSTDTAFHSTNIFQPIPSTEEPFWPSDLKLTTPPSPEQLSEPHFNSEENLVIESTQKISIQNLLSGLNQIETLVKQVHDEVQSQQSNSCGSKCSCEEDEPKTPPEQISLPSGSCECECSCSDCICPEADIFAPILDPTQEEELTRVVSLEEKSIQTEPELNEIDTKKYEGIYCLICGHYDCYCKMTYNHHE